MTCVCRPAHKQFNGAMCWWRVFADQRTASAVVDFAMAQAKSAASARLSGKKSGGGGSKSSGGSGKVVGQFSGLRRWH